MNGLQGESHYPLAKMLGLAIDGITSLSIKPIRIITAIGVLTSFFSFALIIGYFGLSSRITPLLVGQVHMPL